MELTQIEMIQKENGLLKEGLQTLEITRKALDQKLLEEIQSSHKLRMDNIRLAEFSAQQQAHIQQLEAEIEKLHQAVSNDLDKEVKISVDSLPQKNAKL